MHYEHNGAKEEHRKDVVASQPCEHNGAKEEHRKDVVSSQPCVTAHPEKAISPAKTERPTALHREKSW